VPEPIRRPGTGTSQSPQSRGHFCLLWKTAILSFVLRRLAALCGLEDEVDDFIRSEQWVDLLPIVKDQLITGLQSYGLKTVATLTGFSWRGEDVGGVVAMVRYVEATADGDAALRIAAQQ
jgi:predicted RecB family nuclease